MFSEAGNFVIALLSDKNVNSYLELTGLILAVLDFTGLKIFLESLIDGLIQSLHNLIYNNNNQIADKLEYFGREFLELIKKPFIFYGLDFLDYTASFL